MNWISIQNDERLHLWKQLRSAISSLPLDEQLSSIAKFCASMPIGSRTMDYYSPDDWPTPWEILYYGSFCTSSISLLMFYTFVLVNAESKIDLYLVEDSYETYLVPVIDDHFVLNYELSKVSIYSEVQDRVTILQIFSKNQIKTLT